MGIPMAGLVGPTVALLEFGGGGALVVGLLTRFAAFVLALTKAGAILFMHGSCSLRRPHGVRSRRSGCAPGYLRGHFAATM
jgi:putative oxidoreductase